jgi:hypothetical protein
MVLKTVAFIVLVACVLLHRILKISLIQNCKLVHCTFSFFAILGYIFVSNWSRKLQCITISVQNFCYTNAEVYASWWYSVLWHHIRLTVFWRTILLSSSRQIISTIRCSRHWKCTLNRPWLLSFPVFPIHPVIQHYKPSRWQRVAK